MVSNLMPITVPNYNRNTARHQFGTLIAIPRNPQEEREKWDAAGMRQLSSSASRPNFTQFTSVFREKLYLAENWIRYPWVCQSSLLCRYPHWNSGPSITPF